MYSYNPLITKCPFSSVSAIFPFTKSFPVTINPAPVSFWSFPFAYFVISSEYFLALKLVNLTEASSKPLFDLLITKFSPFPDNLTIAGFPSVFTTLNLNGSFK